MVDVVSGARAVIEHARTVLTAWHKVLAKFGWLAPVYLELVASVCRTFLAFRPQRVSDNRVRRSRLVEGDRVSTLFRARRPSYQRFPH